MANRAVSRKPVPLEARFWKFVQEKGPDDCWLWTGSRDQNGYGTIAQDYGVRPHLRATHVAMALDGRPRTDGMHGLHSCDNPPCVNPRHLRWGTPKDNHQDKMKRGRGVNYVGVDHGCAKLTEDDVRYIRSCGKAGAVLGRELGVSKENIYRILHRQIWKHID